MGDLIYIGPDGMESVDVSEYSTDLMEQFSSIPDMARPLLRGAKDNFQRIKNMLYTSPGFINALKAVLPEETLQVVLTDEQKAQLAKGAVELMTKKDGSLLANLVDPNTKRIVSTVALKSVKGTPEVTRAMTSYAMQMQLAQIAEQIQHVQLAVEEVRQGQEYDRLAMAYSCQQKLLQAMEIEDKVLQRTALLRIAFDAEDSRNLLMLSQSANIEFIKSQPESFFGKLIAGTTPEKVNARMIEIRESFCALNMTSLAEAIAYQEMDEMTAARKSLEYYAEYLDKTYLSSEGLVERLDMIDPSPENYWSKTLPDIERRIRALPCSQRLKSIKGGVDDDAEAV